MRTWPGEDDGFEGLAEVLGEGSAAVMDHRNTGGGDFTSTYTDYAVNTNAYWSASELMADASHYGTAIAYGSA